MARIKDVFKYISSYHQIILRLRVNIFLEMQILSKKLLNSETSSNNDAIIVVQPLSYWYNG